mgnify:CR=1 FL=1|jgi:hypothetical protein
MFLLKLSYIRKENWMILVLLTLSTIFLQAQSEVTQKPVEGAVFDFGLGLGANLPMGDLKDRYGSNLSFSIGSHYILPSNWLFNGEFIYYYSDNVKEDVLAPFRTQSGILLGDDDQTADIFLRQRGMYLGLGVGKLFPFSKQSRSGIKVLINGGILQHNIKFMDQRNAFPMVRAGRHTGYDRLTRGFALKETITYKHMSSDRRVNFDIGFDFIQGFTSEVRAFNFDTGLPTIQSRLDLMAGIRFSWYLAFYKSGTGETIYYY